MKKEAVINQIYNDMTRTYEYFVKGYDITESIKILLLEHKKAYDKEKRVFAGIDGYIEAHKQYEAELQRQLQDVIIPRFKVGQECYTLLGKDIEKVRIEKIIATIGKLADETFTLYSITDSMGYACRLPEEQLFSTKEEAEQHLKLLDQDKKDTI